MSHGKHRTSKFNFDERLGSAGTRGNLSLRVNFRLCIDLRFRFHLWLRVYG